MQEKLWVLTQVIVEYKHRDRRVADMEMNAAIVEDIHITDDNV